MYKNSSDKKVLAVIPARGGSKGIPKKNLVKLTRKPLIAHSIQTALRSKYVTRVVVSTDDSEISTVSKNFGAEVVNRPPEISGDNASSELALLHVLEHLDVKEGYKPDILVFLQCTAPLTTYEDLDGTIEALLNEEADSSLAVTPFHYFLWKPDNKTGNSIGINHDKSRRILRQAQEPQYLETGSVYIMRAEQFRKQKHRFFGKTAMYVTPPDRYLEIDDPVDLNIAKAVLADRSNNDIFSALPDPVSALVLDFDGVLTNNKVVVDENGIESVTCDRSDGFAISRLRDNDLPVIVISSEKNRVVKTRCEKLNIPCLTGIDDKLTVLKKWVNDNKINICNIVYVGNDTNDLECIQASGCGVAVGDAHPNVIKEADIVLSNPGGSGAVREIIEQIMKKMGGR